MAMNLETLNKGYAAIDEIERGDEVLSNDPDLRFKRGLVALVRSALNPEMNVIKLSMPDPKLADSALEVMSNIIATLQVSNKNRVGRKIYQGVEAVKEVLPDEDSETLTGISRNWLQKTFPGRIDRWERETQVQKATLQPQTV